MRVPALVLALVAALVGCTPSSPPAPSPPPPSAVPSGVEAGVEAGLDALLTARAAAVLRHDRSGWLAPVDFSAPAFRREQSEAWTVITRLPVASWRWTRVGGVTAYSPGPGSPEERLGGTARGATWSVRVRLDYRLSGTDDPPVRRDWTLVLRHTSGTWSLVGEQAPSAPAPWDAAPAHVLRRDDVILVVSVSAGLPGEWADLVAVAARRVRRVLGPFRLRPLVVVPAPSAAKPRDEGSVHLLAAVTEGARVRLEPSAVARLSAEGRVVVLAHELTHVSAELPHVRRASVPAWLDEGFADWVGWSGSGVPVAVVAAELIAQVRVSGVPSGLPADAAFDVGRGGAPEAYESAWLACRLLAARRGPTRFVAFYRDAQRRGLVRALATAYALTPKALTALWRGEVRLAAEA